MGMLTRRQAYIAARRVLRRAGVRPSDLSPSYTPGVGTLWLGEEGRIPLAEQTVATLTNTLRGALRLYHARTGLERVLIRSGITYRAAEKLTGISPGLLYKYASGQVCPGAVNAARLAEVFGVSTWPKRKEKTV